MLFSHTPGYRLSKDNLTTFFRGDSTFQSATFNTEEYTSAYPEHHENLAYFLTVVQYFQVNIIPITWQPALDDLGHGTSAVVTQSMIHANLNFAFKRTASDTAYSTLISEVAILSLPQIRGHANINALEGICWEIRDQGSDTTPAVRPVLVYTKAEFGDLRNFMKSEVGMNLSLRQKLDICLGIAQALDELHSCSVVHGDLKPENCLIFREDVADKFIAKVIDFGFSSIWARPDDLIQVSMTKPWNAPEWHHRGFVFCEARKMDVYSFGLLCLWVAVQSRDLEEPIQNVKALLFTAQGEFQFDALERLKNNGSLVEDLTKLLQPQGPEKTPEHSMLLEVIQGTLRADVETRDSGLSGALAVLDGGNRSDKEPIKENLLNSLLPAHSHIDLTDSYLLLQIASSEIEVRLYLVTELLSACKDDWQFNCADCRRNCSFQLAFHYFSGFGIARDAISSERWLKESNSTTENLQSLVAGMRRWAFDQPLYRPGSVQKLDEQGIIEIHKADFRWSYDPNLRARIDEMLTLETGDMENSMGKTNCMTLIVKQRAAWNLNERGDYLKAMDFRSDVYDALMPTDSIDKLGLALAASQLASTLADLGRLDEAGDLSEKAVGIYVRSFGNDHSKTWGSLSTLSFVRTLQGRYQEALEINFNIVKSVETLFGKHHPIVCHFLHNMSSLYYYQGLLPDAERLSRDVLARHLYSLGDSDSNTARSKAQLAIVLVDLGRLPEAEALHNEVVHHFRTAMGEEHPNTLVALCELAVVYRLQRRLQKAETVLTKCLNLASQSMGPNHPSSLGIASTLSSVLADQLRFEEALEIEAQLYPKMKVVKGQGHPQTLVVMNNLALTYSEIGRLKDSEELMLQLLQAKTSSLGCDHPQTITTRGTLAKLYEKQSRLREAEVLYREILGVRERISGPTDKFTLRAKSDLSALLQRTGEFEEALNLVKQVLEARETIYGPSHYLIFQALNRIASIQNSMEQFKEEEMTRIHILERSKSYAGRDHPETLNAIQQMAKFYTTRRDWQKAEMCLEEEVALWRRLNSEDKSGLIMALANLAVTNGYQGQWSIAAGLMQEVFNGKVDSLGKEHPDSIEAQELLDHLNLQARSESSEAVRQSTWQTLMNAKVT